MQKPPAQAPQLATFDLILQTLAKRTLLCMAVAFLGAGIYGKATSGLIQARQNATLQNTRTIAVSLWQYANDHNDHYPDGATSTEVFQKLMDGGHVTDGAIFYTSLLASQKTPWKSGKLKPENVCFDVTGGIEVNSPDDLPVVFLTGYQITYVSGTPPRPKRGAFEDGLAVALKDNTAKWMKKTSVGFRYFIAAPFDAKGQTYRQLTPDGK